MSQDCSVALIGGILPTVRRNHLSCPRCRSDKQKCNPTERNWYPLRQRCDRCERLDHECGPPERKKRKRILKSIPTSLPDNSQCDLSASAEQPSSQSPVNSPIVASIADMGSCQKFSVNDAAGVGQPRLSNRKRSEEKGRASLKRLEDLLAVERILSHEEAFVKFIQQKIGHSDLIDAAQKFVAKILKAKEKELISRLRETASMNTEDMGTAKEAYLARLKAYMDNIERKRPTIEEPFSGADEAQTAVQQISASIRVSYYQCQQRKGHFSDAEFVTSGMFLDSGSSIPPIRSADSEAQATYERAASDINHELEPLVLESDSSEFITEDWSDFPSLFQFRSYPIAHLAYATGHRRLAYRLWEQHSASRSDVDLLQRTPIHHAVNNNDIRTLQQLVSYEPDILQSVASDIFGFSSTAIAAIRGPLNLFDYLIGKGAPLTYDKENRGILALASRAGNKPVVDRILRNGLFSPPLTEALHLAIEGGHENVASLLVKSLGLSLTWGDSHDDLLSMIDYARLRQMHQVAKEIHELHEASPFLRNPAITSLHELRYDECQRNGYDHNDNAPHHRRNFGFHETHLQNSFLSSVSQPNPSTQVDSLNEFAIELDRSFAWPGSSTPFDGLGYN